MDDDFFDDGDFGCDGDDFMDDDSDGEFYNDSSNEEMQDDSEQEDDAIEIGWEEIAMAGSLSEEIAEQEKERRRLEKKMDADLGNLDQEDDI